MNIERYSHHHQPQWDAFVQASRSGTFLFQRDYMDYHSDRFDDHSLLFYDDKGRLLALLPAHQDGATLSSHNGLTYGGLVINDAVKVETMLALFGALLAYCAGQGIRRVVYKPVPHIYHRLPADEDLYALAHYGAHLEQRALLTCIALANRLPFHSSRVEGVRKARKHGLISRETPDLPAYWGILADLLAQNLGSPPVHTLAEMQRLQACFPRSIRLFAAYQGEDMLAGALIYETDLVARTQYIAATEQGKRLGALDALFDDLLNNVYAGKRFFDFGGSEDPGSQALNHGLLFQKEGFGGRSVIMDRYALEVVL